MARWLSNHKDESRRALCIRCRSGCRFDDGGGNDIMPLDDFVGVIGTLQRRVCAHSRAAVERDPHPHGAVRPVVDCAGLGRC